MMQGASRDTPGLAKQGLSPAPRPGGEGSAVVTEGELQCWVEPEGRHCHPTAPQARLADEYPSLSPPAL